MFPQKLRLTFARLRNDISRKIEFFTHNTLRTPYIYHTFEFAITWPTSWSQWSEVERSVHCEFKIMSLRITGTIFMLCWKGLLRTRHFNDLKSTVWYWAWHDIYCMICNKNYYFIWENVFCWNVQVTFFIGYFILQLTFLNILCMAGTFCI